MDLDRKRLDDGLEVRIQDRIAIVTLSRPQVLNAIDPNLMRDLVVTFDDLDRRDDVCVVLLTGEGRRAFSAGIDLHAAARPENERWLRSMAMSGVDRNVFEAVLGCRKPVVAALNGVAVGAGCELALACDIRLGATGIRIGLPEARRGLGANFGSHILPRIVPRGIAFELLYTGALIDADRAVEAGLLNRVVQADRLLDEAMALCQEIAGNAPLTVRRMKANVTHGADLPLAAAVRLPLAPDPYTSEDRREGVAAYLEKRVPRWQAR